MNQLQASIGEAGRNRGAYGKKPIGISSQLEAGVSTEEIAGLVRTILGDTREVMR